MARRDARRLRGSTSAVRGSIIEASALLICVIAVSDVAFVRLPQIPSTEYVVFPFLIWAATSDELVPVAGTEAQARKFDELGYRYEFDLFQPADHLTLSANDQYAPAAAFLGTDKVNRDPAHVTYVYNPTMDFAALGT